MNVKRRIAAAAALGALAWLVYAWAPGFEPDRPMEFFTGRIERIEDETWKITVRSDPGQVRSFVLDERTELTAGERNVTIEFEDLRIGDRVSVEFAGEYVYGVHVLDSEEEEEDDE